MVGNWPDLQMENSLCWSTTFLPNNMNMVRQTSTFQCPALCRRSRILPLLCLKYLHLKRNGNRQPRGGGPGKDSKGGSRNVNPALVNCDTIDQDQDTVETVVSLQDTCKKQLDQVAKRPLLDSPQGQLTSTSDTPVTSSDSELDFDGEDIDDQ